MSKIRIPRKKKKHIRHDNICHCFPNVPKVERYLCYFRVEYGCKRRKMSAEQLCNTFGVYTMDDVIWWAWVRRKHIGIEPQLSERYLGYWNFFKDKGVIV